MKWLRRALALTSILLAGPAYMALFGNISFGNDWRTADRSSTGIAPDPSIAQEAIVQVYSARAFNWRGIFAVHNLIATKPNKASQFTIHEVMGCRVWSDEPLRLALLLLACHILFLYLVFVYFLCFYILFSCISFVMRHFCAIVAL